jgi:hypothetical protein
MWQSAGYLAGRGGNMGLSKGNMTVVRFAVKPRAGAPDVAVEALGDTQGFDSAYEPYAWVDNTPPRDGVRRGWVHPCDPTRPDFASVNPSAYAFTLREDKIAINATYKKIAVTDAENRRKETLGVTKLSRSDRKDIKEAVLEDLQRRALPSVTLVDVVYVPKSRMLYVFSSSASQIELATNYFSECFDVFLDRFDGIEGAGYDHLLWVWMQEAKEIVVEDRLTLERVGTGEKTIVVGEDPGTSEDAKYGLSRGKRPSELRFLFTVDDHVFKVGLVASGAGTTISRLGAPKVAAATPEELLDERWGLCSLVVDRLDHLAEVSAAEREAAGWDKRAAAWIDAQSGE